MKIYAINADYQARNTYGNYKIKPNIINNSFNNIAKISFKGGNKNQVIMYVAETKPYFQAGGVATVMEDLRALRVSDTDPEITNDFKKSHDFFKQPNKAIVDPFYNGQIIYDTKKGIAQSVEVPRIPKGLPADSPLKKYEGKYFMTNVQTFQKYLNAEEFFKNEDIIKADGKRNLNINGNIWILEDVTGPEKKMMDFGGLGESEIKLFQVFRDDKGTLKPTHDFKIFTDVTASWPKPYSGGGYSTVPGELSQTWKGDGDAKAAKAFVEFIPRITEIIKKGGVDFDPATVMLNDSQAGYVSEYMARKAATGDEFWKGKKPTFVGHNLGDGYIQKTSYQNMFVDIADKDLRNAIYHDPEYAKAAKEGGDAVENYFKALIPKEMKDAQEGVSPFRNTLYYAEHGYIPTVSTVSELYKEMLSTNPDFAPGTYEYLKRLAEKEQFVGILNAFENVAMDPTQPGIPGYYNKYTFPNIDEVGGLKGKIIPALETFDAEKIKPENLDAEYIRSVKRKNKIAVLERFDKKTLEALEKLKDVKGHEKDFNTVVAGLWDKNATVYGHISEDIINEAKKEGSRVKMLASWGRVDAQKALDSTMKSFIEYVKKNGDKDPYSVLFVGGPTADETQKCIDIIKQYEHDPKVSGRIVFIDSFLPNKPFASAADFTVFPSRFAPCELTDLESMKLFASPIVTNCQGLAQKNFDETFTGEADKVTGYKTKHEYFISIEEIKKNLSEDDVKKLEKDFEKFKKSITEPYRLSHGGAQMTDEKFWDIVHNDGGINYDFNFKVLRPYRDKIIENELLGCYERALIEDYGKAVQDKMYINHRRILTDWEHNNLLKPDGIVSAEKYRKYHFQRDGKPVAEQDTLLAKLRNNCKEAINRAKKAGYNEGNSLSFGRKIINALKSKTGIATIAGVAIGATAFVGYKSGWFSPEFDKKKKNGHLSCIG